MISWNEYIYFSIVSAVLLLSVIGLWFTLVIPGIDRWNKRFFIIYFIAFLLCGLSYICEVIFQYYGTTRSVFIALLLLESLVLSIPLLMLTAYLLHCCGENMRSSKLLHAVLGLEAVYVILLVITPFIDDFIYIASENQYFRGPMYPLFLVPQIGVMMLNFTATIRRRAQLPRKVFSAFLVSILPITTALIVHIFVEAFLLIDISYILSSLAMYSLILSNQIEQDHLQQQKIIRQQQEIVHERASIMVLQMRPHFIYNVLMSIYSLCRIDPQKAQQVILDFTNYLRKNFNAVASDSTIPFSTELEHTQAYLAVEQSQYDDMLAVDYDTPYTQFRLPPLTLQPIVENAVKHGMDLDSDPLHISIRTRSTGSGAEIIVEDTGPGFDPSDENTPHITLRNIQQRLEMMCGGSMTIMPRKERGTVVKLTIP